MDLEKGFPLFEILRLWVYLVNSSESRATSGLNEYDGDHAPSVGFVLSAPSGFFVGLLRAKLGLAAERRVALGLSCGLSKMFQLQLLLQGFFFKFLHQFTSKALVIFLLLNATHQELK
ncbi:hypothetical protein HKD37_07G019155 [Glycine soja]